MLNNSIKEKILNLIKINSEGISSTEISKKLKINRITLAKYLSVLNSEGVLYYRDIGMAKVWYLHKTPPVMEYFSGKNGHSIKNIMDILGEGLFVADSKHKIVWANKTLRSLINKQEGIVGEKICDLFNSMNTKNECVNNIHKSELTYIKNPDLKFRSTISPILNSNQNAVGYIYLLKID